LQMEMVCVLHAASAQPQAPVALTISVQLATAQNSLLNMLLGSGESPGWNMPQLLYLGGQLGDSQQSRLCLRRQQQQLIAQSPAAAACDAC
jgi:hypothetical protein